jgi:hypothetical protein
MSRGSGRSSLLILFFFFFSENFFCRQGCPLLDSLDSETPLLCHISHMLWYQTLYWEEKWDRKEWWDPPGRPTP